MRKDRVLFISLLFSVSQALETGAPATQSSKIIYKKSESHQFSGSHLKGQLKKPELSYIYERKGIRQEKIVHIPENFNQEIVHGASEF